MSSGMKGMMGGSSLANVSRYARWFLDGSCGNSHTGLRSGITLLNGSITITHTAPEVAVTSTCVQNNLPSSFQIHCTASWICWEVSVNTKERVNSRSFLNRHHDCEQTHTSQVWLSLLTAGLLSPITTAKKPFTFLYSLQLWQKTRKRLVRVVNAKHYTTVLK